MRVLVVGKGSRVFGFGDLAAAMLPHGHELIDPSQAPGQLRGDALLLLGFENWYLDAPLKLLDRAAAEGIPRILWQFEPLLPPGLPALTQAFVARSSGPSARGAVEGAGLVDRLAHGYRVSKLLVAARQQSWGSAIFSPHVFKYPVQQSRNVASFWDRGLFDQIFVSLRPRAAFLGELQIPSTFVPSGYTPTLGR
ncbi:MAG: hypothetical protein ABWY63_14625, partial [Hyphomicrobiaceae bacterium]